MITACLHLAGCSPGRSWSSTVASGMHEQPRGPIAVQIHCMAFVAVLKLYFSAWQTAAAGETMLRELPGDGRLRASTDVIMAAHSLEDSNDVLLCT